MLSRKAKWGIEKDMEKQREKWEKGKEKVLCLGRGSECYAFCVFDSYIIYNLGNGYSVCFNISGMCHDSVGIVYFPKFQGLGA